jgi:hypothetical protein
MKMYPRTVVGENMGWIVSVQDKGYGWPVGNMVTKIMGRQKVGHCFTSWVIREVLNKESSPCNWLLNRFISMTSSLE